MLTAVRLRKVVMLVLTGDEAVAVVRLIDGAAAVAVAGAAVAVVADLGR